MGCRSCGGGAVTLIYQVRLPNGTVRRYSSEAEAKAAAKASGGEYQRLNR